MAPFNEPVGNDFDLLTHLAGRLQMEGLPQLVIPGAHEYFGTVLRRFEDHQLRAVVRWYPTHFFHVWHALYPCQITLDAYLFENDGEGDGRRGLLQELINSHQLGDGFNATLAPLPGSFREPSCWPEAAKRPSRGLLLMSDPLSVEPRNGQLGSYMQLDDFRLLGRLLRSRFIEQPKILAHVVFCFGNPGVSSRYSTLTQTLSVVWRESFGSDGPTICRGVKWGSFMVFLGCCACQETPMSPAWNVLEERIRRSLGQAHRSPVTFFDERGNAH
jgi:hypothetical protein